MARRLIGLDVGTNAVTVAEVTPGDPPRLDLFAQVALSREAMREGEVADDAAVADAVARLRAEVGLKKTPVRVGIASPRVIVRQIEMPAMTHAELAGALQFQAGDLIPIPIDDAVLDFAILGNDTNADGEPTMRVLLAAAQAATVLRLVAAVEAGGLPVAAVDLVPLALTRVLARPVHALEPVGAGPGGGVAVADDGVGAEGIVSFGGGVTSIAVHEAGVPRFVRVLGNGGRELTDAIASELDIPAETAEALKRQIASGSDDELVARARTAIDRPLSVLLDEVRSSIDYYRNQPGAARLLRVVATGGSSQLPGLPERLSALVGVPVEPAHPRELIALGDIGFADDELPRLDAYLPGAVGLALGGAGVGIVVDLLPRHRRGRVTRTSILEPRVVAAGVALVAVLGGATVLAHRSLADEKSARADAQAAVTRLHAQMSRIGDVRDKAQSIEALKAETSALLAADVGWPAMLEDLGRALPNGVWLTSLQVSRTVASAAGAAGSTGSSGTASGATTPSTAATSAGSATGAGATGAGETSGTGAATGSAATGAAKPSLISGTVAIAGIAKDYPSLAAWIDSMAHDPAVTNVWVATAMKSSFGGVDVISFTATATLADGARSDRLESFVEGAS